MKTQALTNVDIAPFAPAFAQDSDLARLVARWPTLPANVKAAIAALIG